MKARYVGHPKQDSPRSVGFAGKTFPRDVFIDVSDVPQPLLGKLSTNPYFEVSDKPLSAKEQTVAAEAVKEAEVEAAPAPDSKGDAASLLAELQAIAAKHPDVEVDPTWGEAKLKSALEEARFLHDDED